MTKDTPLSTPEPTNKDSSGSPGTVSPPPQEAPSATPTTTYPPAPAPAPAFAPGPYPQAAFQYPADSAAEVRPTRSRGKRLALLIAGAAVVGAMLFGGGFWTGTVVNSPGISNSRFGDGPRLGPGGPRDGDQGPGRRSDSDTDSDSEDSSDTSSFAG